MKPLDDHQAKVQYLREYFTSHPLFTLDSTKTIKGEKYGYRTLVMYLKPWKSGGYKNLCGGASPGCIDNCLGKTSGMLAWESSQEAEQRRTDLFFFDREAFLECAIKEIAKHVAYCEKHDFIPVVRFNGSSDFPFEIYAPRLMWAFPTTVFYDYSKVLSRVLKSLTDPSWPINYSLVYSLSEKPESPTEAAQVLAAGGKVAVVFGPTVPGKMPKSYVIPTTFMGVDVVDGDKSDLVFLQPPSTILGLKAKGSARHDVTGFVVRNAN